MAANMGADPRNIKHGWEIPKEHYCDQPYVVVTGEGAWLCVMTTGSLEEGKGGQHVVSTISVDQGRTWSPLVEIEPANGPAASWAMPLLVPSGRIYVFYTYNADGIREVPARAPDARLPGEFAVDRVDTLGHMVFRYSDDHGRTWSARRTRIPIRSFEIDERNAHEGKVQYFWGVGKPILHDGAVYIGFAKVGAFGHGFMLVSEGAFLKSFNILSEADPDRIEWETLPDGVVGLRPPYGPIGDEHNAVGLSDGSLYCTFRTVAGFPAHAYSRDGGHTWTAPEPMTYAPGGKRVKHPRAANFVKKFSNGRYLYWFHNHGRDRTDDPGAAYDDRNPAWICGGVERDGAICWSQPEILLYDADPAVRISYPDFIEDGGRYFVTETQKTIARSHEIDRRLLEAVWTQHEAGAVAKEGLFLVRDHLELSRASRHPMPRLGDLRDGGGFTLELVLRLSEWAPDLVLFDSRDEAGSGIRVVLTDRWTVQLELNDGRTCAAWACDQGTIALDRRHHLAFIVEGGPKLVLAVVDGVLCDGGEERPFGFGRFSPHLRDVSGGETFRVAGRGQPCTIELLRLYGRPLLVTEAVWHARQ